MLIKISESSNAIAIESTREIFFLSRKVTSGKSKTASNTEKAKGTSISCAT
jgi:hypothetical protein